jgi:hypothetical protein
MRFHRTAGIRNGIGVPSKNLTPGGPVHIFRGNRSGRIRRPFHLSIIVLQPSASHENP